MHARRLLSGHSTRRRSERGASLVEYALLVALIAVALLTAVTALGEAGSESLDRSASSIASASP